MRRQYGLVLFAVLGITSAASAGDPYIHSVDVNGRTLSGDVSVYPVEVGAAGVPVQSSYSAVPNSTVSDFMGESLFYEVGGKAVVCIPGPCPNGGGSSDPAYVEWKDTLAALERQGVTVGTNGELLCPETNCVGCNWTKPIQFRSLAVTEHGIDQQAAYDAWNSFRNGKQMANSATCSSQIEGWYDFSSSPATSAEGCRGYVVWGPCSQQGSEWKFDTYFVFSHCYNVQALYQTFDRDCTETELKDKLATEIAGSGKTGIKSEFEELLKSYDDSSSTFFNGGQPGTSYSNLWDPRPAAPDASTVGEDLNDRLVDGLPSGVADGIKATSDALQPGQVADGFGTGTGPGTLRGVEGAIDNGFGQIGGQLGGIGDKLDGVLGGLPGGDGFGEFVEGLEEGAGGDPAARGAPDWGADLVGEGVAKENIDDQVDGWKGTVASYFPPPVVSGGACTMSENLAIFGGSVPVEIDLCDFETSLRVAGNFLFACVGFACMIWVWSGSRKDA